MAEFRYAHHFSIYSIVIYVHGYQGDYIIALVGIVCITSKV
jgi:hypothetical protein